MKRITVLLLSLLLCFFVAGESAFAAAATANEAPVLKETTCYEQAGKTICTFVFKSIKDSSYRVYRRNDGSKKYTRLGDVKAKSGTVSFQDKTVKKGKIYYYTVRRIYNGGKSLSKYNATGIKGICFDCAPKIVLTTHSADITFKTTPHANKYTLYRKVGNTDWRAIKSFSATKNSTVSFRDIYYQTLTTAQEKSYLINDTFIDPTANPFRYEVRAIYTTAGGAISRGHYAKEGSCIVATPALQEVSISGKNATFVWAGVPVAKSFNLYAKTSKNASWQKLKVVSASAGNVQKATVSLTKDFHYFTVRAFADVRGKLVSGGFETNFSIINRKYTNQKALFLGDSIALGRPYKGEALRYSTYSKRVEQLLGMRCDNIAITAATISDSYAKIKKQSVLVDQLRQVFQGELPNIPAGFDKPASLPKLWEYDYIVLQGGTNDYNASIPFGEPDSTDTSTFNGALNTINELIRLTNEKRRALGKEDIRVIVLDISYAGRCGGNYKEVKCRQETPNALGYTAADYSEQLIATMRLSGLDVRILPSTAILNEQNCVYESADNLHYTKLGYGKMGNMIAYTIMNWN